MGTSVYFNHPLMRVGHLKIHAKQEVHEQQECNLELELTAFNENYMYIT